MQRRTRTWIALGLGMAIIGCIVLAQKSLTHWVSASATMANPAPVPEQVKAVIEGSPDRRVAILSAWDTGKIIQREVAVREIGAHLASQGALPDALRKIVLDGAVDADLDVRETCLSILQREGDPALLSLISAQLDDCDPQVRLLGLDHLRHLDSREGVVAVMPILDDGNPEVAATGVKLLEKWSGKEFGVKVRDVLPAIDDATGLAKYPGDGLAKLKSAVAMAKAWWVAQRKNYTLTRGEIPGKIMATREVISAGDFSLFDVKGRLVKLSDFRGKVVVLNFWTTWCTACVAEIPELVQLQQERMNNVVILGVSLDSLPDDDGDIKPDSGPEKIKAKVLRSIETHKINYPVMLDEHDEAGGQFNGGELPTTVIIDADGKIRRRIVGARQLTTFKAMIEEASRPLVAAGTGKLTE